MTGQLVTIALLPLLARQYGPVSFGEYAIFVSITALAGIIGTARYEMAIVLPRSNREADAIAHLGLRLLLAVTVGITLIGSASTLIPSFLPSRWVWLALLLGPAVFLIGYTSLLTQWLTRAGRFGAIGANRIVQSGVTGAAQALLCYVVPPSGLGLTLGLLVGQTVAALLLTLVDASGKRILKIHSDRRWSYLLRKYRRLPALLMPQTFVDSFRLNGLNLLIGQFSVSALGQYSQAWRLVQLPVGLVGSAISQVYFPRLAATARDDLYRTARASVAKALAFGAIPFGLILWLSPALFPIFLGEQWAEAGEYAQALVPALYGILASAPISTVFIVLRKEHVGLMYSIIYSALSLFTVYLFREDVLLAIWLMSGVQAVSSIAYIAIALRLAKRAATKSRAAET
ncbi:MULTISPECIES: oligosaccharide flippase family protein [Microbacterium]|uniref:oligosaccharide flippase family protein n=1 Tax=Microbacterium TaxID=33882 RepID=UPI0028F1049B|nr:MULTISPECIES: oligosaccharide flippase family protein [Microbacterium]